MPSLKNINPKHHKYVCACYAQDLCWACGEPVPHGTMHCQRCVACTDDIKDIRNRAVESYKRLMPCERCGRQTVASAKVLHTPGADTSPWCFKTDWFAMWVQIAKHELLCLVCRHEELYAKEKK